MQEWGALTTDDKLRQVPGFSLLRRSGSQTANPTSQGVSLRGLGASGASRALVLADGIPLNDPFGGWIYWARIPQASLSEVQVVPGGVSALYGNDALSGVVNLETRPSVQTDAFVQGSYGNENAPWGSGWGAIRAGQWSVAASGEGFRTDGYIAVPQSIRGSVDTPVASQYGSGTYKIERLLSDRGRIFLDGSLYGENRDNGTPLQVNNSTIRQLAFGTDYDSKAAGLFTLRLYGGTQNYYQTFSSVAANRNSESLDQRSACSRAADGTHRAMVEAVCEPSHLAGRPRWHGRHRLQRRSHLLRRQADSEFGERRNAAVAGRLRRRHLPDHAEVVGDVLRTRRSVEQLQRQLIANSNHRQANIHCLS